MRGRTSSSAPPCPLTPTISLSLSFFYSERRDLTRQGETMKIVQETLPTTEGWVQVKSIKKFNALMEAGQNVYFQCTTPFAKGRKENDLVEVCGSDEGIFIENLSHDKGRGFLDEFLSSCYPEIRKALNVNSNSNVLQNIADAIGAGFKSPRP